MSRFVIYTPQAFREPQGQTRGAIEGNAADDAFMMVRNENRVCQFWFSGVI